MLSLDEIIKYALEEDRAFHDVTTTYILEQGKKGKAYGIAKSDGIMAGGWVTQKVFFNLDPTISFSQKKEERKPFKKGEFLFEVEGKISSILKAERVALNFLQRMCGIATATSTFVEKVKGTGVKIMDTRKTTPLLRTLEKYSVKAGGGVNHRFDLEEMVLIKENHITAAGSLRDAIRMAKRSKKFIEAEVKNLEELKIVLEEGASRVMLDNFTIEKIREAVKMAKGKIEIEVSGGVKLENIEEIAKTGVDMISIGYLTHSFQSSDISLILGNQNE